MPSQISRQTAKARALKTKRDGFTTEAQSGVAFDRAHAEVRNQSSSSCSSRLRKAYVAANPSVFLHTWSGRAKA